MLQKQSRHLLRFLRAACSHPQHRVPPELQYLSGTIQQSLSAEVIGPLTPGSCLNYQQQQWQQRFLFTDGIHCLPIDASPNARLYSTTGNSSSSSVSSDGSSSSSAGSDGSTPNSETTPATTGASPRGRDMGIVFTCAKCDTRSVKTFSRQSYERGLVLIRCPGCQALHLIADHLGWFEDTGFKIDEYLAAQGQKVRRVRLDDLHDHDPAASEEQQVSAEDIVGWSKVQQLLSTVAAAADNGSSSSAPSSGGCPGDNKYDGGDHGGQHAEFVEGSGSSSSSSPSDSTGSSLTLSSALQSISEGGVVDVSPEDVQAWVRIQQQQQQQQ